MEKYIVYCFTGEEAYYSKPFDSEKEAKEAAQFLRKMFDRHEFVNINVETEDIAE